VTKALPLALLPLFAAGFLAACGASSGAKAPTLVTVTQNGETQVGTLTCSAGPTTGKYNYAECGVTFPIVTRQSGKNSHQLVSSNEFTVSVKSGR
jgi:hypothetical protein